MADYLIASIQEKIDVSIYLNTEVSTEQVETLKKELLEFPGVKEVEYISADEALAKFKEKHKDDPVISESLEEVGVNPLYPSINIKAEKPNQYAAILAFLNQESFKDIVKKVDYTKKKTLIEKLFTLTANINWLGIGLGLIFGVTTLLIALNSIRIAIQDSSEEIGIMRLVGASNWYTRGPFIVQSIVWGVLAGVIAFGVVFLIAYFASPKILYITNGFNMFEWFGKNAFWLFCFQLGTGIGLSILASLIATRKFLKV
ncbi:permease-like cell division protein FtsX [bacterium]|nr:permease-like cell division protein FtsX [bacterium]